jgi:ABC-2 type transport system permease protein
MTSTTAIADAGRRARRVTGAFMWLGATETVAYPLSVVIGFGIAPATIPIMYLFLSRIVEETSKVGFDYYTFVVLGYVVNTALNGGLNSFSKAVNQAIQVGQFETYLVQPISWFTLPFALAAWPIAQSLITAAIMGTLALLLGASIEFTALPMACLILALGIAAAHAIGTLAASVRILSKKADPVVAIYSLGAMVFSGQVFPIELLPTWIRPIAYALPHTYVLSAIRRVLMPRGDALEGPSVALSIAVLLATIVILYAVCLWSFHRSLEIGRRYGILGGY